MTHKVYSEYQTAYIAIIPILDTNIFIRVHKYTHEILSSFWS